MLSPHSKTIGPPTNRQLVLGGLALLGLVFPAFLVDSQIVAWIKDLRGESSSVFFLAPVELMASALGAALILAVLLLCERDRRRDVGRVAVAVLLAGLLTLVLKIVFARQRPSVFDGCSGIWTSFQGLFHALRGGNLELLGDQTLQSFPSGHVTTAAALAVGLACLYPRGRWWFAAVIPLVALQRIAELEHYVSDILSGAGVGVLMSSFVLRHRLWDFLGPATALRQPRMPD